MDDSLKIGSVVRIVPEMIDESTEDGEVLMSCLDKVYLVYAITETYDTPNHFTLSTVLEDCKDDDIVGYVKKGLTVPFRFIRSEIEEVNITLQDYLVINKISDIEELKQQLTDICSNYNYAIEKVFTIDSRLGSKEVELCNKVIKFYNKFKEKFPNLLSKTVSDDVSTFFSLNNKKRYKSCIVPIDDANFMFEMDIPPYHKVPYKEEIRIQPIGFTNMVIYNNEGKFELTEDVVNEFIKKTEKDGIVFGEVGFRVSNNLTVSERFSRILQIDTTNISHRMKNFKFDPKTKILTADVKIYKKDINIYQYKFGVRGFVVNHTDGQYDKLTQIVTFDLIPKY